MSKSGLAGQYTMGQLPILFILMKKYLILPILNDVFIAMDRELLLAIFLLSSPAFYLFLIVISPLNHLGQGNSVKFVHLILCLWPFV